MAASKQGRLRSRPGSQRNLGSDVTGLRRTGLEADRDGLLYVPESFQRHKPSPLIVTFHGAGGDAHHGIEPFREFADRTGTILLAPESQGSTWDLILGGYGEDIYLLDEALSDVFALYSIDPQRLAIAGFSDGATYALSVGMTHGDLFSHIIAFSPGFSAPSGAKDSPPVFISHGTGDKVLPIDHCSRQLVPRLKEAGLDVTYEEFEGGHTIPTDVGRRAFIWFLGRDAIDETKGASMHSREAGIEFT